MREHNLQDIEPYRLNLALKQDFVDMGLDLHEVFNDLTPHDLDRENRCLEALLDFIHRFQQYGSQQTMRLLEGEETWPPVSPLFGLEDDWYRFELWLSGNPTRLTVLEQLPDGFVVKKLEDIPTEALESELERLVEAIGGAGITIELPEGMPVRLQYLELLNLVMEVHELNSPHGDGWTFDGCSGFCPGCVQRPWCESGGSCCWKEDRAVEKIHFTEELAPYLSASPQSFGIITKLQAKEDEMFARRQRENSPYLEGPPFLDHEGLRRYKWEGDDLPF